MDSAAKTSSRLSPTPGSRIFSIDALRGLVMIIMALDHVRDFFHVGAMSFSPTDLSRTTPVLFFTRWITHFCLPVFMFAAGMGAFLYGQRRQKGQLARFLLTRGLWFIVLELTVMQFAYNFNFSFRFLIFLLILWIFGICMVAMAPLVYLPMRALAVLSVAIMVLHNCRNLLHQPGVIPVAGKPAGYCFAQIFLLEPQARQRIMLRLGLALTVAFLVLRAINRYGDPAPWSHQKPAIFTVLSFLNCTKYPGSLDFLLMTLGPSLLVLAYFDRRTFKFANPLIIFGRVPMFYFVLHFYLIHILVVLAAFIRYGSGAAKFIFNLVPSMGSPREMFPPDFGYSLWVAYGVWILVVVLLYPVCLWFAKVKARRKDWWLSYL